MVPPVPRSLPIIDAGDLVAGTPRRHAVAAQIGRACRDSGFFYVVGHGVDEALQRRLIDVSRRFFALDDAVKMRIGMARGGRAWRGYFPVGDELTSGRPDHKEGIYFGAELAPDHPLVRAGTPMHGPNLFPDELPQMRAVVLQYIAAMTDLAHRVTAGLAASLGLDEAHFADRYTRDPLVLFRIFRYPQSSDAARWGVGEHTDYGLLTLLLQDETGGLEVKAPAGWIEAAPVPGSLVCNIGDMLDRLTRGLYRSTAHRVRCSSASDRLSFPFFFDPSYFARVQPLPLPHSSELHDDREQRWDRASVHAFEGTYGDYLLGKVSKVFPQLRTALGPDPA